MEINNFDAKTTSNSMKDRYLVKKIIAILILILVNLPIVFFDDVKNINIFLLESTIQLIVNIFLLYYLRIKIVSLPVIFIIFSYIFNMGTLIVTVLHINVKLPFDPYTMFSNEVFFESCKFYIFSQIFLMLGMIVSLKSKNLTVKRPVEQILKVSRGRAKRLGYFLFWIGIGPRLYIDMTKIVLYLHGGYLATYGLKMSSMLPIIAGMAQVGIMLIIISSEDKPKFAKKLLFITIIYEAIAMLSGNRIDAIVYILTLVYGYLHFVGKLNRKKFIQLIIGAYIGLTFINFIGIAREESFKGTDLVKVLTQSPIWGMLANFGGTLVSLSYSILFFPSSVAFNHGKTYLYAPLITIPFVSHILPTATKQFVFISNFPGGAATSLGGSYLGELYYNFGFIGIIGSFVVGLIIIFAHNKAMKYIKQHNFIKFSIMMIVFQQIIIWIRGYFSSGIRTIVYSLIFIGIIYLISRKRYKYKGYIL